MTTGKSISVFATSLTYEAGANTPALRPGVQLRKGHVAIVVTDPQVDFLSPQGVTWSVVGKNVTENNTVENIGQLFLAAKGHDVPLFISPHYYFPHDHPWAFEGALERLMHDIRMFDRPGPLDTTGLEGSGADWLKQYEHVRRAEGGACRDGHTLGYTINAGLLHLGAANVPAVGDNYLTMNSADGVRATQTLALKHVYPAHFEGWRHFTEGSWYIVREFEKAGLTPSLHLLKPGEATNFVV